MLTARALQLVCLTGVIKKKKKHFKVVFLLAKGCMEMFRVAKVLLLAQRVSFVSCSRAAVSTVLCQRWEFPVVPANISTKV